jgi:hypothetical protein
MPSELGVHWLYQQFLGQTQEMFLELLQFGHIKKILCTCQDTGLESEETLQSGPSNLKWLFPENKLVAS